MKIKWLGHSSFLITAEKGTKIITDPYTTGGNLHYKEIKETADIVTVSHEHFDHNNIATVTGKPQVFKGPAATEIKGIKFYGVSTYHDENTGKERGTNMITCMDIDGIKVCHLGDLGHTLTPQEVEKIGKVDVLFIPVGGFYTIDAATATLVSSGLKPKVIIPMHYKNEGCSFPVAPVDDFLKDNKNIVKPNSAEIELKAGKLPAATQVIVLNHAM
ncbi:MAG: MBL fold metallo-hydrolase [Dehalococcoidales bacterium]|nr:MBL fold metallo-hydrolase [Dehalococcoidales bacterium]